MYTVQCTRYVLQTKMVNSAIFMATLYDVINFYTSHLPTYFLVNEIMITMILLTPIPHIPDTWRQEDKLYVVSR